MPTGYTAGIIDGISFKTYALNCARAFGACVLLRDEEGGGEKIPDAFEPSDYHLKEVEKFKAAYNRLTEMTARELELAAHEDYAKLEAARLTRIQEREDQRRAYEAMLEQVNQWSAPTPDHVRFHEFMRTQIEKSIKFDCDGYDDPPVERITPQEWLEKRREDLLWSISYHEKGYADELARTESRNAWIKALRESLPE